jgi:SAM-dependent methyltransferase
MYPEIKTHHNWLIKKAVNDKVRESLSGFYGSVLDLGCGVRPFEKDILQYADEYIGLDWGNTLHGTHADVISDLNKPLPISDASVDHIVTFEVMEHLAEPQIMLAEAFRVMRGGGQLTLSVPFQWWVHEAPWDYQRFTRHGLDYHLDKAGFSNIVITPTTGFWSMWILKFNYQTARLIRGPRALRLLIRALLVPMWWLNQTLAPALDRIWPEDRETAGYFVTARKP